MKLTDYQKEFLLTNFFHTNQYAGWKDIAIKLLEQGSCIVAGKSCIWTGFYVDDFIEIRESERFIDCVEYVFDLKSFLLSERYIKIQNEKLEILTIQLNDIEKKIIDIKQIGNPFTNFNV